MEPGWSGIHDTEPWGGPAGADGRAGRDGWGPEEYWVDARDAADELERARQARTGIGLFSRRPGGLSESQAWAIAAEVDRRRLARGERRTGYKLGWTSAAMREALGIASANFGSLWEGMQVEGVLDAGALLHPKAEPEFAFRATAGLEGSDCTAEQVRDAGTWAVSLEIVDPRWETYEFTWEDNTADGSSAAAYACGEFVDVSDPPGELTLAMSVDGDEPRQGSGDAAMGSPAEAVAYLVRELHARGERLDEGMVVLTGGITAPVDLLPGTRLRVTSPSLGSVDLRCRDVS